MRMVEYMSLIDDLRKRDRVILMNDWTVDAVIADCMDLRDVTHEQAEKLFASSPMI